MQKCCIQYVRTDRRPSMNRSSILKKFLTGVKIISHLVKISSTIKRIQEIHMSIFISRKKLKYKMSFLPPTIIWYLKLRSRTITKRNDENGIKRMYESGYKETSCKKQKILTKEILNLDEEISAISHVLNSQLNNYDFIKDQE